MDDAALLRTMGSASRATTHKDSASTFETVNFLPDSSACKLVEHEGRCFQLHIPPTLLRESGAVPDNNHQAVGCFRMSCLLTRHSNKCCSGLRRKTNTAAGRMKVGPDLAQKSGPAVGEKGCSRAARCRGQEDSVQLASRSSQDGALCMGCSLGCSYWRSSIEIVGSSTHSCVGFLAEKQCFNL
eukprot:6472214-Amphidinium_carterae.1